VSEFTNHNGILVHPEIYTYDYQGNTVDHVLPNHPDFPAAVEALKELVAEPFEWEIDGHTVFGPKKPDGSIPNRIADVRQSGDDARLIAAAPSLLQALSEVVAEWDERNRRYCAEHGPGYYPPEDTGGIMLARAAIAKVKNQPPDLTAGEFNRSE